MRYESKVTLKNGMKCLLRNPESKDAAAILQHLILTSGETDNMARYPDEFSMTKEQESAHLGKIADSTDAVMIAAEIDGKIVANCGFNPVARLERCRHRAEFGISIQKGWWGLGIGSLLMETAIEVAKEAGYEQLELDVVTTNFRAVALYEHHEFIRYGTHPRAFRYRDGNYADLLLMTRTL